MYAQIVIRLVLILVGVVLLVSTIFSLARRMMTETFCLVWGVLSLVLVVAGFVVSPAQWSVYVSDSATVILIIVGICFIWCSFFMTKQISILNRKNQELAMQISLLNQENEKILERLNLVEKSGEQ